MLFNATFNNISFILWRSLFFDGGIESTRKKHWPTARYWQKLYHLMLYRVHLAEFFIFFYKLWLMSSYDFIIVTMKCMHWMPYCRYIIHSNLSKMWFINTIICCLSPLKFVSHIQPEAKCNGYNLMRAPIPVRRVYSIQHYVIEFVNDLRQQKNSS
jgi:hypothetical protein